jgi:hypothetical protein
VTTPNTLVERFGDAKDNPRKLTGWCKSLTAYCQRRSEETGTPPSRFKAAIKAVLTKQGHDTAQI